MSEISVVLAHTNDSQDLVKCVEEEIDFLNNAIGLETRITLRKWENVPAGAGNVEKKVLKKIDIDDTDFFIEIFRYTFGNPTGMPDETGKPYESGMLQEFDIAYKAFLDNQKRNIMDSPHILLFKSEEPVPRAYLTKDSAHQTKINAFFNECQTGGKHQVLYKTFDSADKFKEVFRENFIPVLFDKIHAKDSTRVQNRINNYEDIFFSSRNEERNAQKLRGISKSKTIRLCAKSCQSFLNPLGRFSPEMHGTKSDTDIRIIMQNPWSMTSLIVALGNEKVDQYRCGEISCEDLLQAYQNSNWFKYRFSGSIDGYNELKKDHPNIHLRLTDHDLASSILLFDNRVFFEPYLNSIRVGMRHLSMFEVMASSESDIYTLSENDFESKWTYASVPYEEYVQNTEKYKERLRKYLEEILKYE